MKPLPHGWMRIAVPAFVVAALLLGRVLGPAPGGAPGEKREKGLRLTPEIQAQLRALPRFGGGAPGGETLQGKVVLVTFFASWCPPCREELQHLKKVHAANRGRGLEVVAVNLFEDFDNFSNDEKLMAFLEKIRPGFPVVKGDQAISLTFGDIRRIPSLFIFGRSGGQVFHFNNERAGPSTTANPQQLESVITSLL